jgi:FixJ family two-component response regulator
LDVKNRRLPTSEKGNLHGGTSQRYAKSSIYHIFVCNLVRRNNFAYLFGAVLCVYFDSRSSSFQAAVAGRFPLAKAHIKMASAPVIHIVDDDKSFRIALARLLKASGYEVADYESAACFLRSVEHSRPGCIILDVQMPALSGLQLQEELAKLSHIWPIIFVTGHGDIPTSVLAIKGGAEDFLSKPVSSQTLLPAIERALVRYASLQKSHDQLNSLKSLVATLTPRESEVFALMVRGRLNKQIAFQLGTSERTIKAHRHMVMQKLNVQWFAEAVSIAERLGLLSQPSQVEHSRAKDSR